jgi:hypothetical protein
LQYRHARLESALRAKRYTMRDVYAQEFAAMRAVA